MRFIRLFVVVGLAFSSGLAAQPANDPITETELREHIAVLADDDFGGRKPGTIYENKTVNYIATEWMKAGLKPAASKTSWYQPLQFAERNHLNQTATITIMQGKRTKTHMLTRDDIKLRGAMELGMIKNGQVVFAGFNSVANDKLRAAYEGKVVLISFRALESSPDFASYSDRVQQLRDAGASVILTLVEDDAWEGMSRRYARRSVSLEGEGKHATLEGIVNIKTITKAVKRGGGDFRELIKLASEGDFQSELLPMLADLRAGTQVRIYPSHNVIGKIPGTKPDSGAVLYTGHWDHLGTCGETDAADPDKDLICNGAVDNASGIAVMIEVAKRLAQTPHDRDIYFLATTSEEMGLLGAQGFAENPVLDLDSIAAVFNIDTVALAPNGKEIAIVGRGKSTLDADLEIVAKEEGRVIDTSDAANAFVDRQDGAIFLRRGIPAYMVTSAFADPDLLKAFLSGPYHAPSDEFDNNLLLGGATDDANFHVALGRYFASTERFEGGGDENATSVTQPN